MIWPWKVSLARVGRRSGGKASRDVVFVDEVKECRSVMMSPSIVLWMGKESERRWRKVEFVEV